MAIVICEVNACIPPPSPTWLRPSHTLANGSGPLLSCEGIMGIETLTLSFTRSQVCTRWAYHFTPDCMRSKGSNSGITHICSVGRDWFLLIVWTGRRQTFEGDPRAAHVLPVSRQKTAAQQTILFLHSCTPSTTSAPYSYPPILCCHLNIVRWPPRELVFRFEGVYRLWDYEIMRWLGIWCSRSISAVSDSTYVVGSFRSTSQFYKENSM